MRVWKMTTSSLFPWLNFFNCQRQYFCVLSFFDTPDQTAWTADRKFSRNSCHLVDRQNITVHRKWALFCQTHSIPDYGNFQFNGLKTLMCLKKKAKEETYKNIPRPWYLVGGGEGQLEEERREERETIMYRVNFILRNHAHLLSLQKMRQAYITRWQLMKRRLTVQGRVSLGWHLYIMSLLVRVYF